MKKHIITEEEYGRIKELAKKNKHKRVDKRLQVILLRYEGLTDEKIGEKLGYSRKRVSQLCAEFKAVGAAEYARHKYGGNHRAMSVDEETELLEKLRKGLARARLYRHRKLRLNLIKNVARIRAEGTSICFWSVTIGEKLCRDLGTQRKQATR